MGRFEGCEIRSLEHCEALSSTKHSLLSAYNPKVKCGKAPFPRSGNFKWRFSSNTQV